MKAYDPRAIANLILDVADAAGIGISNLALQKLLYFSHGLYLMQNKRPLVTGYFEAWKYGPVHPAVYTAFKNAGSDAVKARAFGVDPLTGKRTPLQVPTDREVVELIEEIVRRYGKLSPGRLVDLSHAPGSPWDAVANKQGTDIAFGMRIQDNVILERFRHHKVSVGANPRAGEPPGEDTPLA